VAEEEQAASLLYGPSGPAACTCEDAAMKIILETPRLVLREMTPGDLDFLADLLGDPQVMRFYPQDYARADAEAWLGRALDRYARHGHAHWLVLDRAAGHPVGQVGLVRQTVEGVDEDEIGYLIHRPFWRHGYASEAACAVRDHAFGPLGRDHVISLIRPINHPSRGVARKMGMKPIRLTLFGGLEHLVYRVDRGA
jgi:RimJ/RimL family protein N-acetyltransferase